MDGETDSTSGRATSRDVSGESSTAFVEFVSASRVTRLFGTLFLECAGSVIMATVLGVGVIGGGSWLLFARFLGGVDGADALESGFVFLLLAVWRGGGIVSAAGTGVTWLLIREDLLVAAAMFRVCREVVDKRGNCDVVMRFEIWDKGKRFMWRMM